MNPEEPNFHVAGKSTPTTRGLILLAFLPTSDLGDCKEWKEIPAVVEKCEHEVEATRIGNDPWEIRCEVCNFKYTMASTKGTN